MPSKSHIERVKKDLKRVGVTWYGLHKLAVKFLPNVIKLDEQIGGIVYGQVPSGSALLVATNQRIIFVDRKPFFTTSDELTYDVVSGVRIHTGGPFCTVVLHTRINNYRIRYVNAQCARIFVSYIEHRRINPGKYDQHQGRFEHKDEEAVPLVANRSDSAASFLRQHKSGVLSTVNHNKAHGSVVHYVVDDNDYIYLVTTPDSRKVQNIASNPQVSLTIFELESEITVRIEGTASIEQNYEKISQVANELGKQKTAQYERFTQEVSNPQKELLVIKIDPIRMELTNYRKKK